MLAFHAYADKHGTLPPAAVCGADGRPLLSWRVLLLPYIEQDELFKRFRMDEPWNSEHNLSLLTPMPSTYRAPWIKYVDVPPDHTVLRVFVGPGAAFEGRRGLSLSEFKDGTSNTLLFVEAGDPVPWTKPDDFAFDPDRPVMPRGLFRDGYRAATADAGYRFVRHDTNWASLKAAITRNGGEPGPWDR